MTAPGSAESRARQSESLTLTDAISVIVGIVVGAGIYETVPLILSNVTSPAAAIGAWLLGGLCSLIGALCFAELASTYPRSGGDYVYLTRAFSPWAGFLFGWAQLAVIRSGTTGMMAFVFADYAVVLFDLAAESAWIYAAASVALLTLSNVLGQTTGKRTQNLLTLLKVLGLSAVLVAGFFFGSEQSAAAQSRTDTSFGVAMILVLYTYGGWNDAALISAEVRDPRKNVPRALFIGIAAITVLYVLVNLAYVSALGFEGARGSQAIAAETLGLAFGDRGKKAMSLAAMLSALGAVSGLVYTGSRLYSSLGEDHELFRRLGRWNARFGTPVWSLATQGAITIVLIGVVGSSSGQALIDTLLKAFFVTPTSWDGRRGFDTLLQCTAPVFWFFFFLTGLSLFVLRRKDRDLPRSFSVPLYPVVPLLFCAISLWMLWSAISYAGALSLVGLVPILLGVPLYLLSARHSQPR